MLTLKKFKKQLGKHTNKLLIDSWVETLNDKAPEENGQDIKGCPIFYSIVRFAVYKPGSSYRVCIYKFFQEIDGILNPLGYWIRKASVHNKHLLPEKGEKCL